MADLTGMMQAAAGVGGGGPPFTLYTWGLNGDQRWMDFTESVRSSPSQTGSLLFWNQVASSGQSTQGFTLGVSSDNALYAWGYNLAGQLGTNATSTRSSAFRIGALNDWAQVTCGGSSTDGFTLAIKTDGTLWAWGDGDNGKTGLNSQVDRSSPVQVGALSNWAQVAAGIVTSHAVKTNGTLWGWGSNSSGQIGDGTITARSSPVQVGALSNWAQVATGGFHTLAVKTDGTLWGWGSNFAGRLANVGGTSPRQIGALTNWAYVAAAQNISAAIKTDGTLWTWGSGAQGALGDGSNTDRSSPVQVGALTDWASVNCGDDGSGPYMLATKTDGTAWAWGSNNAGRLGINSESPASTNSPVQIGALTNWAKVIDMGTYNNFGGMLANE